MKKQTKKTAGNKEVAKKKKRGGEDLKSPGCNSGCSSTYQTETGRQVVDPIG